MIRMLLSWCRAVLCAGSDGFVLTGSSFPSRPSVCDAKTLRFFTGLVNTETVHPQSRRPVSAGEVLPEEEDHEEA